MSKLPGQNKLQLEQIEIVMKEKDLLTESAKQLIKLLDQSGKDRSEIKSTVLDISNHLSKIGSFCDKNTQSWIDRVSRNFGILMVHTSLYDTAFKAILPGLVAIQLDTNKRPFKVNLSVALKDLIKAKFKFSNQD